MKRVKMYCQSFQNENETKKEKLEKWRRENSIVDRWESKSETGDWKMESQSMLSKAKCWLMSWCQLPRDSMPWWNVRAIFSSELQIERAILYVSSTQHCFGLPTDLGLKLNLRNLWSLSNTRRRNGCVSFEVAMLPNNLSCCLSIVMLRYFSSAAAMTCMLEIRLKNESWIFMILHKHLQCKTSNRLRSHWFNQTLSSLYCNCLNIKDLNKASLRRIRKFTWYQMRWIFMKTLHGVANLPSERGCYIGIFR